MGIECVLGEGNGATVLDFRERRHDSRFYDVEVGNK